MDTSEGNTWDILMSALDRISTMVEGTPNPLFLEIHHIAGEAMRAGNAEKKRVEARAGDGAGRGRWNDQR